MIELPTRRMASLSLDDIREIGPLRGGLYAKHTWNIAEYLRRLRAIYGDRSPLPMQWPTLQEWRFIAAPLGELFSGLLGYIQDIANSRGELEGWTPTALAQACFMPIYEEMTLGHGTERGDGTLGKHVALMLAQWAYYAFPTVSTSSAVGSSLVATVGENTGVIRAPWDSFAVLCGDGLLSDSEVALFVFAPLILEQADGPQPVGPVYSLVLPAARLGAKNLFSITTTAATLSEFADLELPEEGYDFDHPQFLVAFGKLIAGICLALSSDNATITKRLSRQRGTCTVTQSELKGGTYVLGLPIKCDLTKEVSDWVAGRTKSITRSAVRWLVRGHWRQQACGELHRDHRSTWIAPYWKGPERAAALVRPHVLGNIDPNSETPEA